MILFRKNKIGAIGILFLVFIFSSFPNLSSAEVAPGEGILFYGDSTLSSPNILRQRVWNAGNQSFDAEATANIVSDATVHYTAMKASPTRNEYLAVVQGENGSGNPTIRAYRFDGTSWNLEWTETATATTSEVNNLRYVDVSYEASSGDALVTWSEWTTTNELAYKTWNGSSWTASASFNLADTTAAVCGLITKSVPSTDNIIIGYTVNATTNSLNAAVWNGGGWASEGPSSGALETGAMEPGTACLRWAFDVDVEHVSKTAMIVWGQSGTSTAHYSTCDTTSLPCTWTNDATFGGESGDNIALDTLDGTDQMIASYMGTDSGTDAQSAHWLGSGGGGWGTTVNDNAADTVITGGRMAANAWIVDGANSKGVSLYADGTSTVLDYQELNGTTWTANPNANCGTGTTEEVSQMWIRPDPFDKSRMLVLSLDQGQDMNIRKFTVSGTTETCGDADGGTPVNSNIENKSFNFAFANHARPTQTHFQWFNDDFAIDSMDNAASISAEDVPASGSEALSINQVYRLRTQISNEGPASASNNKYRIEMTKAAATSCSTKAAGWNWSTIPLTASIASHAFDIDSSGQFSDGASTSANLLTAEDPFFTAGYAFSNRATSNYESLSGNNYTEFEWALKPNANAVVGSVYCFRLGRITNDSTTPDTIGSVSYSVIASASVQAALSTTFTQKNYQWRYSANSIDPAGALAAENTAASIFTTQQVRLRVNLTVGTSNLDASTQAFKLKYSQSLSGPWSNVGATTSFTTWRFYENTNVAHGTTVGSSLLLTGSDIRGVYHASNSMPTNPNSATTTQDIEYDFSLDATRTNPNTTYYFRVFKSNDDPISGFTNNPTINVEKNNPPHVDGGGGPGSPGGQGNSGGGNSSTGGNNSGGGNSSNPTGQGDSGGGAVEDGGGVIDSGGASPVMFDWHWLATLIGLFLIE